MRPGAWLARLACWAGGFAATGCATKAPQVLDLAALRASQPRTVVAAQARGPAITAQGPEREGFVLGSMGALGAVISYEMTNQRRASWMKRCEIDDPVGQIRETVAESIAEVLSLEEFESRRKTKATGLDDVMKDYDGVDLIVDIRTSRWGIQYVPGASVRGEVHFAAIYEGSLRLIDARKSAVIAEATCAIQYSNGDDPPTLNELFQDDCALLRKGLTLSAQTCAKRYRTRTLGVD